MSWLARIVRNRFELWEPTAAFAGASADLAQEMAPKPRLASVLQAPAKEEFEAWRDESVTKFVMAALLRNANECREAWLLESWEQGKADQRTLDALRERSDALLGFTADYEAFCETLNLQPEQT